jgi:hypothetical protein
MNKYFGHIGNKCPTPCVPDSHILIGLRAFVKRLLRHDLTASDTVSDFFPDTSPGDISGHIPLSLFREGMSDVRLCGGFEKKRRRHALSGEQGV